MTLLRTLARQIEGPDEILRRLNDELEAQNPRSMFVTMSCLDVRRGGRVTCANAGHDTALLLGKAALRPVFPSTGTVLGLFPDQDDWVLDERAKLRAEAYGAFMRLTEETAGQHDLSPDSSRIAFVGGEPTRLRDFRQSPVPEVQLLGRPLAFTRSAARGWDRFGSQ